MKLASLLHDYNSDWKCAAKSYLNYFVLIFEAPKFFPFNLSAPNFMNTSL